MPFRFLSIVLVLLIGLTASASRAAEAPSSQGALPRAQPVVSYKMDVRLDPAAKTVAGAQRITFRNTSTDRLSELWLRLYLRAFSSKDTLWMRESGGGMRGFNFDADHLGDITVHKLSLAGGMDLLASATITDTLMRVPLPRVLGPGESIELDAAWTSKLPRAFARTGYGGRNDTFFMVGQWYPKMAVYDRGRWDTEPWHARSEFFNDFGDYDVRLTTPEPYVVAGAGVPVGEPEVRDGLRTQRWRSTSVTDWAFAASPDFKTRSAQAGDAEVVLYYLPEHAAAIDEYIKTSTGSLETLSRWFGAYPHPRLTVVDVPDNAAGAGGMEYPTLVTGGTLGMPMSSGMVSVVVSHEIGHQWWPMQTATNEGREPWLDEGLSEYSGTRYMAETGRMIGLGNARVSAAALERAQYATDPKEPATLPAWSYSEAAYGAAVYGRTALGLWTLENVVGTDRFRAAMHDYLAQYRWKHPSGADFRASLERSLGQNLDWFFDGYLRTPGVIDYAAAPIGNSPSGSLVRLERRGEVQAPVDVRITTASGRQETRSWDGRDSRITYTLPAGDPAVRVEIDPDQKLKAELDILNNGTSASVEVPATITVGGKLTFWTQLVGQLLGLFG